MLEKIIDTWSAMEMELLPWAAGNGVLLLRRTDELTASLEDSLVKLQTLAASPHIRPHATRVEQWQENLRSVHTMVQVGRRPTLPIHTLTPLSRWCTSAGGGCCRRWVGWWGKGYFLRRVLLSTAL